MGFSTRDGADDLIPGGYGRPRAAHTRRFAGIPWTANRRRGADADGSPGRLQDPAGFPPAGTGRWRTVLPGAGPFVVDAAGAAVRVGQVAAPHVRARARPLVVLHSGRADAAGDAAVGACPAENGRDGRRTRSAARRRIGFSGCGGDRQNRPPRGPRQSPGGSRRYHPVTVGDLGSRRARRCKASGGRRRGVPRSSVLLVDFEAGDAADDREHDGPRRRRRPVPAATASSIVDTAPMPVRAGHTVAAGGAGAQARCSRTGGTWPAGGAAGYHSSGSGHWYPSGMV